MRTPAAIEAIARNRPGLKALNDADSEISQLFESCKCVCIEPHVVKISVWGRATHVLVALVFVRIKFNVCEFE